MGSDGIETATWQSDDGAVRLYCGDCLAVLGGIEDESIDVIWTDPPYGHGNADGDFLSRRDEIMHDGRATVQIAIANDTLADTKRVVDGMLTEAARVLKRDCCCCCCCCCGGGGPSPTFAWVANRMDSGGLSFFHSVIWDKLNPGIGWRYRRQHEMVMVAHRAGGKLRWADDKEKQPNIIRLSKPKEQNHPNEKPLKLVSRFLQLHATAGDTVLDPFMGGGGTGVAAVRAGCKFIGIELDREHFNTAKRRIQHALGVGPVDAKQPTLFGGKP